MQWTSSRHDRDWHNLSLDDCEVAMQQLARTEAGNAGGPLETGVVASHPVGCRRMTYVERPNGFTVLAACQDARTSGPMRLEKWIQSVQKEKEVPGRDGQNEKRRGFLESVSRLAQKILAPTLADIKRVSGILLVERQRSTPSIENHSHRSSRRHPGGLVSGRGVDRTPRPWLPARAL